MADEKPTAGFVLSLIAEILILINGIFIAAIGAIIAAVFPGIGCCSRSSASSGQS